METFPYKKVLVTGGAGFIGSHIVEALVNMGVETWSVDDYSAGKEENLAHLAHHDNLHIRKGDVSNSHSIYKIFLEDQIEAVFHNAASKKTVCLRDPLRDLEVNGGGAYIMLELSRAFKVKQFIHASTGSVYGEPTVFPQAESHPLTPVSYYGVSKLAGEKYVKAFNHLFDMDTTVLRYFHVFGPRQEHSDVGGVISIFLKKLLRGEPLTVFGDGTQQRSFTYVKDVVGANLRAACSGFTKGEVYNCASGISITINELIAWMEKLSGVKAVDVIYDDWLPGDIKKFDVSNNHLVEDLQLEFTDFEEGLRETIEWGKKYFLENDK